MKKKYILGIIGLILMLTISFTLYNSAWDINGKSNFFIISIDDSGLKYQGKTIDKNVYSYNLSEVLIQDFFANNLTLSDALANNQISIKRMLTHMSKTIEDIDNQQIIRYGFENYQIIVSGNNYIICPNNIEILEILNKV